MQLTHCGAGARNDLYRYNIATSEWTQLNESTVRGTFPPARAYHGFVSSGGKLYVFAGWEGAGANAQSPGPEEAQGCQKGRARDCRESAPQKGPGHHFRKCRCRDVSSRPGESLPPSVDSECGLVGRTARNPWLADPFASGSDSRLPSRNR